MIWRTGMTAFFTAMALAGSPAMACTPAPVEPRLAGEDEQIYRTRVDALERTRAARWKKQRQESALERADLIFIAGDTPWSPPPYRLRMRNGLVMPPQIRPIPYPAPSYFKPVAWLRGPKTTDLFQLVADNTSCGPMGVGDTTYTRPGKRYVFFARKGRVTRETLIDAIALDKIDDPALIAFVEQHRGPPNR
ncbi:MAG: hypothetical protein EOP60_14845 [Sphingomonadales bacterium]|nr:MAG: hypothetical protein EOP60_14845 [Sphingomonadales bacterium]